VSRIVKLVVLSLAIQAAILCGCAGPRASEALGVVDIPAPSAGAGEARASSPAPRRSHATPLTSSDIFAGQIWTGTYFCAQGVTNMELRIITIDDERVTATFAFLHAATAASGSVAMKGTYDPDTHVLHLDPDRWIIQPPNYVMVGLEGKVADGAIKGRMLHPSCTEFEVR
jgi:hypothetical protein